MQQIVDRVPCVILFALSAWTWCPVRTDGHMVPNENDRTFDWPDDRTDDRTSDWSIDEDDDFDDDDDNVRSAAAEVVRQLDDDVYAGKMMAFFAKLNALRRKRREDLLRKPESSTPQLEGLPSPLPPQPSTDTDRDRKSGFRPATGAARDDNDDDRSNFETDYGAGEDASPSPPPRTHDRLHGGLMTRPDDDGHVWTAQRRRRRGDDDGHSRRRRPAGYLHMGWDSAGCVWRVYRGGADADDGAAGRAELRRRWAREWLEDAARFWAAVVGLSVAAVWAAFGTFHGPLCAAAFVAAPDAHYARDVNRYLNTVPPNAVVTGRGKMFRYRPTAEERFLWKSAKKIAGFKV